MPVSGNYGTPNNPQEIWSSYWQLQWHTGSDPAHVKGDFWGRSDLNSGDRIATAFFDNGNTLDDIPIFPTSLDPGTSDIKKVVRVPTPNGLGWMPIFEGGGAYNYLAYIHADTRHGVHNSRYDIPGSAIYYWDPSTFSTGDSNWTELVTSVDMSLSGDLQSSTFSNGDPAIQGDGVDDSGTAPQSDVLSVLADGGAFEIALQTTQTGRAYTVGVFDGTRFVYLELNSDGSFTDAPGDIAFYLQDDNGDQLSINAGSISFNDGNIHNVTVNVIDASTNDIEMIVDGTVESTTPVRADGPSSFSTLTEDVGYWGRNNQGSIDGYYEGYIGKIGWHDQTTSGQTI